MEKFNIKEWQEQQNKKLTEAKGRTVSPSKIKASNYSAAQLKAISEVIRSFHTFAAGRVNTIDIEIIMDRLGILKMDEYFHIAVSHAGELTAVGENDKARAEKWKLVKQGKAKW